jgi:hypothetical protein
MIKSLSVSAAVLSIILLVNSVSAQTRTSGTLAPNLGTAAQITAVSSVIRSSQVLAIWATPIYNDGNGGNQYGNGNSGYGNNGNSNGKKKKPAPAPEPSTLLSLGAALLIGGGVLYSRRLRRNRK